MTHEQRARLPELVAQGLCKAAIARETGVTFQTITKWCRQDGLKPVRGKSNGRTQQDAKASRERAARFVQMYQQGLTLDKIGRSHGLTRERVRQILKREGIAASEGGARMQSNLRKQRRATSLEAKALAAYGMPHAVVQQLRADGVLRAYQSQKHNADTRGIDFTLSFSEWFLVWQASGKLHLRGRGKGRYVMSRIRDDGCYELGNVHIQLATENSREAVEKWRGKTKDNRGVFCLYPGTARPWFAKAGKARLGFFASEAEAVAARESYLSTHPARRPSSRGYAICTDRKRGYVRYQVMVGKTYVGNFKTPELALAARAAFLERAAAQAEAA